MRNNRKSRLFWRKRAATRDTLFAPMFAILSLWSRPHLRVRRDQVLEARGAKSTLPRTMPMISGLLSPRGRCGLVERLVEPISLLNSAQKPQEVLPRGEKNLIGYREPGSAQRTLKSPFPTWLPGHQRTSAEGQHLESDGKGGGR